MVDQYVLFDWRKSLRISVIAMSSIFGSNGSAWGLDLMQSYRHALEQDPTYLAARAQASVGREALPQARAQLLPSLSASGTRNTNNLYTITQTPYFNRTIEQRSYSEYMSSNYAVTLRQPLFRKYQFAAYFQARAQVEGTEAVFDKERQDVVIRVTGAYFEALGAQDQLNLVLAQKEAYSAQLQSARKALDAGFGTRTDIDDAQARFDMAIAQELEARQNVEHTRRQLQAIINQPIHALSLLDAARLELRAPNPANVEEWIQRGEDFSPELRNLRAQREVVAQELEKARAGHYPTVDLFAQRTINQSDNVTSTRSQYYNTQIGVQVSVPIFQGGYVNSQVRQALANQERISQQHEGVKRDLEVRIRKEFRNITEGILKVKALEQAELSANQAVLSSQKGFEAGMRSRIDILNAQQQRMNVRRDLSQARYLYIMARIRLLGLVGAINEEEISAVNQWLKSET